MRAHHFLVGTTMAGILVVTASCGGPPVETVGSYDQLLVALRSQGLEVETAGTVSQPFFEPEGQVIRLLGGDVQVFEFSTEGEAKTAAATISADGSSIGTSMVSWVSVPHFYGSGKLIVLYVGEEKGVVGALQNILGPQIAGR